MSKISITCVSVDGFQLLLLCTYCMVYSYLCAHKYGMHVHSTVFAHCYKIVYITNIVTYCGGPLIIKYT